MTEVSRAGCRFDGTLHGEARDSFRRLVKQVTTRLLSKNVFEAL
jgi:hypothetical protein